MTRQPTIKADNANTYHRDGTVSYWDVYRQTWDRWPAAAIDDDVLATMTDTERKRIARMASR